MLQHNVQLFVNDESLFAKVINYDMATNNVLSVNFNSGQWDTLSH